MKRTRHITGFYIETLLMIIVFILMILLITNIFGIARAQSNEAKTLTAAVTLSENAAEAVAASEDLDSLYSFINTNENAQLLPDGEGVRARYATDLTPDAEGEIFIDITWQPEETLKGTLIESVISASIAGKETIYSLNTAVYIKDNGA